MKNTMGYGINALLDFDTPVRILEHLVIGSEGTLAFVAEARFRTIPIRPAIATGLLVFTTLSDAMAALPGLGDLGLATIELLDAASLRVAQGLGDVPAAIADIDVDQHAALLVEVHAGSTEELAIDSATALAHFADLPSRSRRRSPPTPRSARRCGTCARASTPLSPEHVRPAPPRCSKTSSCRSTVCW